MSRRSGGIVTVLVIVAALIVTEVALNWVRGPEALVRVENLGAEPIDSLVVMHGTSRTTVPRVEPGATARVYLNGHGPRPLRLRFRQRGNAMAGYECPGVDPALLSRDGFALVLRVRPNEVERYQDDDEPATPLGRIVERFWNRLLKELGVEPDVKTQ